MSPRPAHPAHPGSAAHDVPRIGALAIPDALPADTDPVWRFARAERELARIHAAEQARWLRRCALVRASRAEWGGVTAIVAEPGRADLRARFAADLALWRRERTGAPFDEVVPELGACALAPVSRWPAAGVLAVAAERRDGRVRSAFVHALVTLACGDARAARVRTLALLETELADELRARAFALLGLVCLAERDVRGAWLHLSTASARSSHSGVRAAFELAARLADAPLPPCAHSFDRHDTTAPATRRRARVRAQTENDFARHRARLAEFAARVHAGIHTGGAS